VHHHILLLNAKNYYVCRLPKPRNHNQKAKRGFNPKDRAKGIKPRIGQEAPVDALIA
jgi:hypothetical protein